MPDAVLGQFGEPEVAPDALIVAAVLLNAGPGDERVGPEPAVRQDPRAGGLAGVVAADLEDVAPLPLLALRQGGGVEGAELGVGFLLRGVLLVDLAGLGVHHRLLSPRSRPL